MDDIEHTERNRKIIAKIRRFDAMARNWSTEQAEEYLARLKGE